MSQAEEVFHELSLYRRMIGIQIRSQMQYRFSFLLELFSTGMLNASFFVGLVLVFQRFGSIKGWTLGEVAFLAGMIEMSFATMDMIFSGFDPDTFGPMIQAGTFDQLLLRPMNLTLQVFGSQFFIRRIGRILQGVVIFAIALSLNSVHWTLAKLLYLPVVFASQVVAMGALFIISSTLIFWTVQPLEVVNTVTYGGVELMTYPMHIYSLTIQRIFTYALPFIFLNYYPALYFLEKPDPLGFPMFAPFLAPVAAGLMFFAAIQFWHIGVRAYQSTGT